MEAKLIYAECGRFNGIMRVLIGNTVLSVELGTPYFNDYGEYRLVFNYKSIEYTGYQKVFPQDQINIPICTLSKEAESFWNELIECTKVEKEDDLSIPGHLLDLINKAENRGHVSCGNGENGFMICFEDKWVLYKDLQTDNPFAQLMFPLAEIFFKWQRKEMDLGKNLAENSGLNIY